MPAQAISTGALRSSSSRSSRRCRPATPTSSTSSVAMPWQARASWASAATGRSLVPPPSTATRPRLGSGLGRLPAVRQRACRWCCNWSSSARLGPSSRATAWAFAGSIRVASASSPAAWVAIRIRAICSALLFSPQIASTIPRRWRRPRSRRCSLEPLMALLMAVAVPLQIPGGRDCPGAYRWPGGPPARSAPAPHPTQPVGLLSTAPGWPSESAACLPR